MNKTFVLTSFAVLFFSLVANISYAQISINDSLVSNKPTAISIQDLNVTIELAKAKIKNIRKKTERHESIVEIEKRLPEYQKFINDQKTSYHNFKKSHPNKQKVINIINKWGSYNAYLDTWQTTVNKYLDKK